MSWDYTKKVLVFQSSAGCSWVVKGEMPSIYTASKSAFVRGKSLCEKYIWALARWVGPGHFQKCFFIKVLPRMLSFNLSRILLVLWMRNPESTPLYPAGEYGRAWWGSGAERKEKNSDGVCAIQCKWQQKSSPAKFKIEWFSHCDRK